MFHWTDTKTKKVTRPEDPYQYLQGFGNEHQSEFMPGALPVGQNSPQLCAYGLYAEQTTGTSFAASRAASMRNFLYRRRPACVHRNSRKIDYNPTIEASFLNPGLDVHIIASQVSWKPFKIPEIGVEDVDFTMGIHTLGGSGQPNIREGLANHIFAINSSMSNRAFVNIDGDFLIVPQEGHLDITTEFGHIYLQRSELCIIQEGLRFKVDIVEKYSPKGARGYIIKTWGTKWELPELGPFGGYGLANARDFLFRIADIDASSSVGWSIVSKQGVKYYETSQSHTPFDVVAWHGNYVPYKYDLTKFVSHNTISVDHTNPCINTVLTTKSHDLMAPLCDFLTFGPCRDVAENTFRPPYFHRNCASELLARIYGPEVIGGRSESFSPGGTSYEAGFTHHGVADKCIVGAMHAEMKPMLIGENQLTIILESCRSLLFTHWALHDSGVLVVEDIPESMWDLIPLCLSLTYHLVPRLTICLQDRFGENKEVIEYLKSIGRA